VNNNIAFNWGVLQIAQNIKYKLPMDGVLVKLNNKTLEKLRKKSHLLASTPCTSNNIQQIALKV